MSHARDVVGPYPLAAFRTDSDLRGGLDELTNAGFVTVTAVVDEAISPPIQGFRDAFTVVRPFKAHYVVDNTLGTYQPSSHHRYEIRKTVRNKIEVCAVSLSDIVDEFSDLYETLVSRHSISTANRFTKVSFEALAQCPGLHTVAAYQRGALISCHLWIRHEMNAWSLLAASNAQGYATNAAYAIYDQSIRHFSDCSINIGGIAGNADASDDGLARFKSGFANRTRQSYIAGSVLNHQLYGQLCAVQPGTDTKFYFPQYRAPRIGEQT